MSHLQKSGSTHDTLHSTVQTNRGKCVLCVQRSPPQAGINHGNEIEKKPCRVCAVINEHDEEQECKARRDFEQCRSLGASFVFPLFTKILENPKKVCVEHLDQLIAAEPDIWTRPDQRKRPISVIYLSSLIFSRNRAFSGCYALLATSDAAFVSTKNNSTRMQQRFSWPW